MRFISSKFNYHYKLNSRYTFINNTLTGAIDVMENDIWNLVTNEKFECLDPDPLSSLVERGYLYQDPAEEERILNKLYASYINKALERPIRFVYCPTYTCNLRCTYCFETGHLHSNPNRHMNSEILEKALKASEEFSERYSGKVCSIELFGGEPLLLRNKKLIRKIINFAGKKDSPINIITNGVMAGEFVDILSLIKEKIEMLQITMDGPKRIHDSRRKFISGKGTFDLIVSSIDKLLKNEIKTNIRINIDSTNLEYVPELYDFTVKKGWTEDPNFSIRLALVTDHTTEDYDSTIIPEEQLLEKLINIYDRFPHLENRFGFYMFKPLRHILDITAGAPNVSPKFFNCESNLLELKVMCPDGYIYACGESIGKPELATGRFYPKLEIFAEKEELWTRRTILNIKKCKSCKFAPICGGGCAYSSLAIYGDNLHPICERYQEIIDTFLKFRGEKILKKYID